jgi:hypothetical protein
MYKAHQQFLNTGSVGSKKILDGKIVLFMFDFLPSNHCIFVSLYLILPITHYIWFPFQRAYFSRFHFPLKDPNIT